MSKQQAVGPDRDDPQFQPFWDGTDRHELLVQRCDSCAAFRWPPRPLCGRCHSVAASWTAAPARGALYSWIDVRHQTVPSLPPPYLIGLVQLDHPANVRMLGRLVGVEPEDVWIDMPLTAVFTPSEGGVTLVNWTEPEAGRQ